MTTRARATERRDAARGLRVDHERAGGVRARMLVRRVSSNDDVELEGVGDAPVVAERLQPRRLVVRAHERQAADLHQLWRREEHHLGRIVQERIDERALFDDLTGELVLGGGDGGGEPGRAGADDDNVECMHSSAAARARDGYSNKRLLTIATGRPGMTVFSWPAGVIASRVSPSRLT